MEITKKGSAGILIGLLVTAVVAGLMLLRLPIFETLEDKLYDYRFKVRGPVEPPDEIVIAAIDEKSIERLGRFPWSRDKETLLVEKLAGFGAEIIAFDMFLSESEKNDPALAEAIRDAGNVALPLVFDVFKFDGETPLPDNKFLIESAFISVKNPDMFSKYRPIMAQKVIMPVAQLISQAMTVGQINMFPDEDGTLRWESLVIGCGGYLFPSLTLKVAAVYLGVPPEKIELHATEGIRVGKRFIPTDRYGRTLVNYYGPSQTFRHVSISDILDGGVNPESLRGKIVIIGATAVGIYDLRVTPLAAAMPGVEKHANVIASMLENRFLRRVSAGADLAIVLFCGVLLSFLVSRVKALSASAITATSLSFLFLAGYFLFVHKGLWINITYPALVIVLTFINITAYNYAVEERYSRRIKGMFSSYVTEKVVNELIKNPQMAKLGGERREVTVLFSDVRGFTSYSESHSPEEVVAILNEYLKAMIGVVFRWEGTLDKFIGDAILAFWGAPMKQENHAELAVKCAMNMVKRLEELQEKWRSEGKEPLDVGIGLNTGEVLVGNIGEEGKKMDYTIIGDHVNLGSRVEGLTRKYNTRILITEFTMDKIRDFVNTGEIGHVSIKGLEKVIVKGREKPVEIYELRSMAPEAESVILECEEEKVVRFKEK